MEEYEEYLKQRIAELDTKMKSHYSGSSEYNKFKYSKIELEIALSKFELINHD